MHGEWAWNPLNEPEIDSSSLAFSVGSLLNQLFGKSRKQFPNSPAYYQAALHELGHWMGHPDRLNRVILLEGIVEGPYSRRYAQKELRAEISSMMSVDRLQIGYDPAREGDPDREREPQRPRLPGIEETREAGRDTASPPPLPEPDRGERYRLFQRAWSGPRARVGPMARSSVASTGRIRNPFKEWSTRIGCERDGRCVQTPAEPPCPCPNATKLSRNPTKAIMSAANGGATAPPRRAPIHSRPVDRPRSSGGNHRASARVSVGKAPACAALKRKRTATRTL